MINTTVKKLISLFMVLSLSLVLVPLLSFDGFAADGISMRLEKLKKEFPHGWYYNHKVKTEDDKRISLLESRDESYSQSVSRYPCIDHDGEAEKGTYDCNYFDGGYQCHGFASMLFYEVFGVRQSTLEKSKKAPFEIKPGDLVRLNKDTHSAIVLSVKGDRFTVAECNVGENGEVPSCKISWGKSYKLSDITYFVRAKNYKEVAGDTNWKNIEEKKDLGSSFYGAIYDAAQSKALTVDSKNNVVLKSYSGSASQVWKFTKIKNGSYRIESCKNGKALEVVGAVKAGKAKVKVAKYDSKSSQRWAFYESGSKLYLSADCGVSVLTSESGSICVDKKTSGSARLFTVKKKKAPVASVIKAKGANGKVSLSWSKGNYTRSFDVEIFDASSKLYKQYKKLTATSLKVSLPAGNYSAKIISKNAFSKTAGNTVYFTVGKKGILGKTAKVSATQTLKTISLSWASVPDADGYAVFQKEGGKWKTVATTAKTKYTLKGLSVGKKYTLAIRALKKQNGKISLAKDYTTFTAATKMKAPSKVSATQTTSSIKLTWSALKQADGYRIYQKTSTGWKKVASTSKTGKTIKELTAGKSYTYGVRGYMKTTVGTVWSEIKSITTATKPKAPKVSVSDVKSLRAKIRWNKVSGADGYQVFYKVNGADSYTHLANYKSSDGGVGLSKLTNGAEYTFAVRAYKKVGGKTVYGAYSTVKFKARYL